MEWLIYGIISAVFVGLGIWNGVSNSDNDIVRDIFGVILLLLLLLYNAIWGGIFWW